MNPLFDEVKSLPPEAFSLGRQIDPTHLGTVDYRIIPDDVGSDVVRFIMIPQMKRSRLTASQSMVWGLLRDMARTSRGGERRMSRAKCSEAIDPDYAKLCGLKTWSDTTRSLYLTAYVKAGIVREEGDDLVFIVNGIFWKLPLALLAKPDMKIREKVYWAAMVFLSTNRTHGTDRIGYVPQRAALAQEIGRTKSKKTGKMKKRFATTHLSRLRALGLVRDKRGFSPQCEMAYFVPLQDFCGHDRRLLFGELVNACLAWKGNESSHGLRKIAQRRTDILSLYHPAVQKLEKDIQKQRSARAFGQAEAEAVARLQHDFYCLIRRVIEDLFRLVEEAESREDLMYLGFDFNMEISLFGNTPIPMPCDQHFDDYPGARLMSRESISGHAKFFRGEMQQMLLEGVPNLA